jgi:hypothetical protein
VEEREFYKGIDAKPKKKILENKANNCTFPKAVGEIVDNCLDYWRELDYPSALMIDIANKKDADKTIEVAWNMFIPESRWEPLVRPGDQSHRDPLSIGVWGEGFKIAVFAIGREIEIFTREDASKPEVFIIHIPREWLQNDDWMIPVYRMNKPDFKEGTTLVRLRFGLKPLPTSPDELLNYLAETFGTRMIQEREEGHALSITVDGKEVKPRSYGLKKDLESKFAFPPGMEPTEHIFVERGVTARMVVGLLSEADAENYGVYMYGNGRLFASHLHDERVGFGTKATSKIPQDHPHAKRLQVHLFFEGSPEFIPWAAPLKDNFNHESQPFGPKVSEWIEKYLTPYALFVRYSLQSEIIPYSRKWQELPEDKKIERFFSKAERNKFRDSDIKDMWKKAPPAVKNGISRFPEIEIWDHTKQKHKPRDALKFDSKLVKRMADVFRQRDRGKITSVDVANKLVNGDIPIAVSKDEEIKEEIQNLVKDTDDYVLEETTTTLTIHMNSLRLKNLAQATGKLDPDEIVEHISTIYQQLQGLKNSPHFKKQGEPKSDEELIEALRSLLSE